MGIYKKDYFNLTQEEEKIFNEFKGISDNEPKGIVQMTNHHDSITKRFNIVRENPFVLNVSSIFPNHFLNEPDLAINNEEYELKLNKFIDLLNNDDISERNILKFIKENEAHFIIGSILQNYTDYGHHDRYIFQEFQLPPNYQADFLIIGKNSMGFYFLWIELENPSGKITLKNGDFGDSLRKGINQINDWSHWLEKSYGTLINVFNKHKRIGENLSEEFYSFDSSRMEYAVIAGRRSDFNDKSNRLRREHRRNGIKILHYDNLIDESKRLLKTCTY